MRIIFSTKTLYYISDKGFQVISRSGNSFSNFRKKEIEHYYSIDYVTLGFQKDNFQEVILQKNGKISTQSIFMDI